MSGAAVLVAALAIGLAGRGRLLGHRTALPPRTLTARSPFTAADWAVLLDTIGAGVRAGHSLRDAFVGARAARPPRGRALTAATEFQQLSALSSADPDESVALQTLSVAMSLGGPTAAVLQSGAALLRERAAVRAEAAVHAAQARLSARVLTAVPLLFAAWGTATSPSFRHSLLGPFGAVAACVGLTLNAAGWWWMGRIVRRAQT
jgi:tight adherence protein B